MSGQNEGTTSNPLVPQDPATQPAVPEPMPPALDEFEQAVVQEFEKAEIDAAAFAAARAAEEGGEGEGSAEASTTTTPATPATPEPQPPTDPQAPTPSPADPNAPQPQPESSGATGDSDTPPVADPHADAPDSYLGRSRADVEAALQTLDWARGLPPEALQGMDAYLSGQYVLVPAAQANVSQPTTQLQSQTQTQTTTDDADEYLDPAVAKRLAAMEAELNGLRETTTATVQQQQQEQQNALLRAVETQSAAYAQTKSLTPEEIATLQRTATQLGTMQVGLSLHRTDLNAAVKHALDLAYLSDPSFQSREVDRLLAQRQSEAQTLSARKARAGAVTSASGSAPQPTPTPPSKMTAQEKEKAMIAEVAASMNV